MPIARLIFVSVYPNQIDEVEKIWKEKCGPLMIKQPGCLSEKLLKCADQAGAFISYSEWESQEAIDQYLDSEAHAMIRQYSRALQGGTRPAVRRYEVLN